MISLNVKSTLTLLDAVDESTYSISLLSCLIVPLVFVIET